MRYHRPIVAVLAGGALLSGCAAQPPLQPLMSGPGRGLVHGVQLELIRTGYLAGGADGVLGPHTSAAISRFESANRLPVDGAPSWPLLHRLRGTASASAKWASPSHAAEPEGGWVPPSAPPAGAARPAKPPPGGNWVAPPATNQ